MDSKDALSNFQYLHPCMLTFLLSFNNVNNMENSNPSSNLNSVMQITTPRQAANPSRVHQAEEEDIDYSERSQWLRAAVLGANDGLVSIGSLMMGIGAVRDSDDAKAVILVGFAGLVAGACSMAIGEYVSVYTQLEIELAQIKRESADSQGQDIEGGNKKEKLPNPVIAALASALAFASGAMVPLLSAAFMENYKIRLYATMAAVTLGLVVFGWLGAKLGKTSVLRSCVRVVLGGWIAMAITFGLTKSISTSGGMQI